MKGKYWPGQIAHHQMHPAQAVRSRTSWPQNARHRPATRWTNQLCSSWQVLETDAAVIGKFLRWGWKHQTTMFTMWNENQVTSSLLLIIIINIITITFAIYNNTIQHILPSFQCSEVQKWPYKRASLHLHTGIFITFIITFFMLIFSKSKSEAKRVIIYRVCSVGMDSQSLDYKLSTPSNRPQCHTTDKTELQRTIDIPHSDDRVQIRPDSLCKSGEHICLGWLEISILYDWLHGRVYSVQFISDIDVWNITRVQNVIQIFQEWLTLYLNTIN